MIKNYFKTAWRSIVKNRSTSCINIAGLSIGMAAAVLILLWVQNENSFDQYKGKDPIYRLTTRLPELGWVWETTPLPMADAIKDAVPGIEKTARLCTGDAPVFRIKDQLFNEKACAYVDNNWFSLFPYQFKTGSAAYFTGHPFSVILSSTAAKKYFGAGNAVGQTIRIDTIDYQVSGVVADALVNSSFQFDAFIPVAAWLSNPQVRANDERWSNANYITFIQTIPGIHPASLAAQITATSRKKANDPDLALTDLIALPDMHFETEVQNSLFIHGNRSTVYIFSFLGFLLLLIACINYVNLTTAKASLRAKEVSIRKISGASRADLFFQFIAESLLISLLSLCATIVLIKLCLPAFNTLTEKNFTVSVTSLSLWKVLGVTLLTALLLNSVYPALLLSSFKPLNVFRGKTVLKLKDGSFRKSLVAVQFTISVVLIAGTFIIYRQMQFIQKEDPGYNRSQVLTFRLPATTAFTARGSMLQAIKSDLLAQSNIENVSTANQTLVNMGSYCTECADWAGRDTSYKPKIAQLSADADFQKTMQLTMKEGRWFNEDRGIDKKSFVLNETAVKDFKLRLPVIGQSFIFKGDTGQIIGVVKDFTYKSMHEKIGPLVVFNNPQWRNQFVVRTAGQHASAALQSIEKVWKKYSPGAPFEYTFLDDTFNNLYKKDRQASLLIMIFAVIAVVISASGLFSLTAFGAEQRTKEIGVRKVLGCSVAGITLLLSKDFLKLVALAILIASPITLLAMDKWLQSFAYRISISWWIFILAGLMAMFIAICTVSFQAIKAALANPVQSLRTE